MAAILWAMLGVVAGVCIAVQAPVNAQLSRSLGMPVAAAMVSFVVGSILLTILTLAYSKVEGTVPQWRSPSPWLYVVGGCLGSIYITTVILLTPRIGTTAVMALTLAGQMTAGLVIDRIGFMGLTVRELSAGRIAGALLLIAGVFLIRKY